MSIMKRAGAMARRWLERLPDAGSPVGSGYEPLTKRSVYGKGGLYLTRYTIAVGRGEGPWALHVHQFHRGDEDAAVHGHPWRWALSLVLAGGYREWRPAHGTLRPKDRRPGSINVLTGETLHRVDLLGSEAWTLFLTGPKGGSWAFVEPGAFVPWRDYLRARGLL